MFDRGNDRMDIFRDAQDYSAFLHRLLLALGKNSDSRAPLESESLESHGAPLQAPLRAMQAARRRNPIRITPFEADTFSLVSYCLMPNHFHFLIRQNGDIPISALLLKVLTSYSMYFNRKYDHVGHVFQDRFKAVHIENDTQLKHVSAYIHLNPKVARLVRDARKWQHGSYPEYLDENSGGVCDKTIVLEHFRNAREYERFVEEAFDDIRARKEAVRELMMDI